MNQNSNSKIGISSSLSGFRQDLSVSVLNTNFSQKIGKDPQNPMSIVFGLDQNPTPKVFGKVNSTGKETPLGSKLKEIKNSNSSSSRKEAVRK